VPGAPLDKSAPQYLGSSQFLLTKTDRQTDKQTNTIIMQQRSEDECTTINLFELMERDHSEEPGADGKIILELILGKWGGRL
jgi:hypothetical protein